MWIALLCNFLYQTRQGARSFQVGGDADIQGVLQVSPSGQRRRPQLEEANLQGHRSPR